MRGVCPFCNSFTTVCLCVCVTVCTNDVTGTVWATPGLEQLLSREHRLPLSGLKFKTKSADNDPASHCIREAGCHWQDQVTGYEQALPSTSICYTLLCPALHYSALLWSVLDFPWLWVVAVSTHAHWHCHGSTHGPSHRAEPSQFSGSWSSPIPKISPDLKQTRHPRKIL